MKLPTAMTSHLRTLRFVNLISLCLLSGLFPGCSPENEQSEISENQKEDIHRLLEDQVEAWNTGDLETFMDGYLNSPELTFVSGGTLLRGWAATLERYQRRYQSGDAEMGQLRFADVQTQVTGPTDAWVRGQYHLTFSEGRTGSGRFTLIFKRVDGSWRIIHDHTSSDE